MIGPALTELLGDLKRTGQEWHGPCWRCGGRDRFIVFKDGRGWCRQCSWKGDSIQLLRDRDGLSFREAKRALGLDTSPVSVAMRQKIRVINAAHTAVLDAYQAWQRETLTALTAEYRDLMDEVEMAQVAGRQMTRCPELYNEAEQDWWGQRLAVLSARAEHLEQDLDILTYDVHEALRFAWWREECHG